VDTRLRREAAGVDATRGTTPDSVADVVALIAMLDNSELTGTVVDLPW
jgi:hypothetical protein